MKHLVSCVVGLFCLLMFQAQDGYSSNFGANDHKYDDSDDDYDIGDDPVFVGIPEYVHEQPPHIRFAPATQSSTAPNWKCDVCTFANSGVDKNCAMCSASKPVGANDHKYDDDIWDDDVYNPAIDAVLKDLPGYVYAIEPPHVREARAAREDLPAQSSAAPTWVCNVCTLKNLGVDKNCAVCGTSKPAITADREDGPPPPLVQEEAPECPGCGTRTFRRCTRCTSPEPVPVPFDEGGAKFGAATTHSWPCQTCTFENSGFDATCLICDTPKVSVDDYKSLQNQSKDLNTQIEQLTDEIKVVDEANSMGLTFDELWARNACHNDDSSAVKLIEVAKHILTKTDRSLSVADVIDTLGNFIKDKKNQNLKRKTGIIKRLKDRFGIKTGPAFHVYRILKQIIDRVNKFEGPDTSAPPPVYQRTEKVVRGLVRETYEPSQSKLTDAEYKLTAMFAGNVDKVLDEKTQKVANGFVKKIYKTTNKAHDKEHPLDEDIAYLT
eukprot:10576_1